VTTKEVASYSPPVGCCAPDRRPLPVGRDVWRGWLSTRSRASSLRHPLPYRSATWRLLTWTDKVLTGVTEKHALDRMIYNSRYLERSNNKDDMDYGWPNTGRYSNTVTAQPPRLSLFGGASSEVRRCNCSVVV